MKTSEIKEIVNAPLDKTWNVLFTQYGDIHVHNPNMIASEYMNNATEGEVNCVRSCKFDDKLYLEEKITEVHDKSMIKLEMTKSNLPFIKEIQAEYEVVRLDGNKTEVKMTSHISTSPGFMVHLMSGPMKKALSKHLFGMKYYIETGKTVSKEKYIIAIINK